MTTEPITIEQLLANRKELENEYHAIKNFLAHKIKRMDEIEQQIQQIDTDLIKKTKKDK